MDDFELDAFYSQVFADKNDLNHINKAAMIDAMMSKGEMILPKYQMDLLKKMAMDHIYDIRQSEQHAEDAAALERRLAADERHIAEQEMITKNPAWGSF